MARRLIALAAFFLIATPLAQAEQLQRLHVRSFILTSDTQKPQLDVPFNVTLTIRLAENVPRLENVYLPSFAGPEELGDERQLSHGAGGTVYRETLRLVAHARGPLSIGSGYLDAIDARDGKPKRFISNDLHLFVGASPVLDAWHPLRLIALAFAAMLAAVALAAGILKIVSRMPAPARAAPQTVQAPALEPAPQPPHALDAALAQLRLRRDRDSVMHVRSALWRIAGAKEGQTLGDVLSRPEAGDEDLRRLLIAVERAAFIEEDRIEDAIDAVLTEQEGSIV